MHQTSPKGLNPAEKVEKYLLAKFEVCGSKAEHMPSFRGSGISQDTVSGSHTCLSDYS
jgi:hypothetical protein